ncbi:ABC transporter ATP-binding protein [Litorilinea aerophila]|uniref:ABC transporter ATP-binding protein n=1 Tax=Litorilinea aerophila TaxID=1204385 RepID=A0A540VDA8_9CHLR|nr:ABC transporter ATP-binding protein [Litorilinea aerophila]MCC9077441.1 ABC transporter ATP-binding protein [Litorilinea aerophila]OUC05836.1 peptide ABC transporter ATPase [Litorilinea aerophila]
MDSDSILLEVRNLHTRFFSREGALAAVDGLSFNVRRGEALGIAGESGCGKSVTAQSILRIVPRHGKIVDGEILLHQDDKIVDLVRLDWKGREIRDIRGRVISMVFQEPMAGFSMAYTIGNQIMEVIQLHQRVNRQEARQRAIEILRRVGMPKPEQAIDAYPFALSGGMRQRAMIAMALACTPSLLIADEPTTAVDVTIQAQVLQLMKELQEEMGMALMVITHDLAVISELCDRVMVMYLGKDVESAPAGELFRNPKHPYTVGLLRSVPRLGEGKTQEIQAIEGSVPGPYARPTGCPFHPRCPEFIPHVCDVIPPPQVEVAPDHRVRCHLYADVQPQQEARMVAQNDD